MKLPFSLSNKWHRLALWPAGILLAFVVLLIFTRPSDTPPPAPVEPAYYTTPSAPKPAVPDPDKAQMILELFNPNDQSLTRQLTRSGLEQQIEHALTTSFVLTKCRIISDTDYRDSFRALIRYAQQAHLAEDPTTAEREVRRIAESSGASYALVYSRTKCDDTQLPPLADQLHRWTQLVLTQ